MHDYEKMIRPFAEAMRVQMLGHDSRGFGFRGHIQYNEELPKELFGEMELCVKNLVTVCTEAGGGPLEDQKADILEAAADLANMAMLIALNAGALKLLQEGPK